MNTRIKDWLQTHDTTMLLSLFLWLCALPLILLLTVPFFGWESGIFIAAVALVGLTLVCYALCYFPKIAPHQGDTKNVTRSGLR